MEVYKKLFKTTKFVGNQPITFNKDSFNPKLDYYLTHKLDGIRILLLFANDKVFIINSKREFTEYKFKNTYDKQLLDGTVLDCEYFNKKIFIFDILFFSGNDLRDLKLSNRIYFINKVHKLVHNKKLKIKKYLHNGVCHDFKKLDSLVTSTKNIVDGIIFTPNLSYNNAVPLKWKPTNLLSIDFKIKKLGDNKIALLIHSGKIFIPKNKKYKGVGITTVSEQKYKLYKNGDIIEFIFKNNKFIPIKNRPDKINSNYISVILSNFKTIIHPPNIYKIIGC